MKTKNILFSVACAASLFFGGEVLAKNNPNSDSVVAVVSGSVITQRDLDNRFEFLKRQVNRPIPEDQVPAILQKTLNDLINEEVQNQYAKKYNITVTDDDVKKAIAEIEKRNGLSAGAFNNIVHGIKSTADKKIASDLLRQKIVDSRLRSRVQVSKGEIDRLIENINNGEHQWEKEVLQIFIEADKKDSAKRAQDIYQKFKNGENDFNTLAKTYSDDPSAREGKGGYMGWFGAGELAPALDKELVSLNKGEASEPISTPNGWHILYVADVKEKEALSTDPITEYKLYKYEINLSEAKDPKAARKAFEKEIDDFELLGDMEEMKLRHAEDKAYNASEDLGWVSTNNLTPQMKEALEDLDINEFSDIQKNGDILTVYHLSDKREVLPKQLEQYRQSLYNRLMSTRLELAAKRFMRDLRRQAYIDIRI